MPSLATRAASRRTGVVAAVTAIAAQCHSQSLPPSVRALSELLLLALTPLGRLGVGQLVLVACSHLAHAADDLEAPSLRALETRASMTAERLLAAASQRAAAAVPRSRHDWSSAARAVRTAAWRAAIRDPTAGSFSDVSDESSDVYGTSMELELRVELMVEAFTATLCIAETFGPLMGLGVKNDQANFEKVRTAWEKLGKPPS